MNRVRSDAILAALGRARPVAAALALLAACDRAPDAPPARVAASGAGEVVAALPPLPESELDLEVAYDLAPAVAALEAAVPRTFGDLADRKPVPGNPRLSIAFEARRTPFRVTVRGNTATIASVVTYRARGWYDMRFAPAVSASCGLGDAEPPRLRVALVSTVRLAPDWRLRPRTRIAAVEPASDDPRDRCRVTALSHDVTERVVRAVRGQLEGKAALVDDRLADMDVRRRVDGWWALLQRPIRIRDDLWLEIRPSAVRLGALGAEDGALVAPLALTASPRIVSGARPAAGGVPLPTLGVRGRVGGDSAPAGLRIRLDAALDYVAANRIVAPRLVGRAFARGGERVVVRDAVLSAAPGGRVALTLRVAGAMDGRVRFVGRPVFDAASGDLRVHGLDFDVASDQALVRGFDWLTHGELRDALRARARWPAAALVEQARLRLERALNRDLTTGVRLAATVPTARVLAVHATQAALVLRAEAHGQATLRVRRAPAIRLAARRPVVAARAGP